MSQAITFERKGDKVHIVVDLPAAMKGKTSSGRAGSYGEARIDLGADKDARITLNAFETKKKGLSVNL